MKRFLLPFLTALATIGAADTIVSVPNLARAGAVVNPITGATEQGYRPTVIDLDKVTARNVVTKCGYQIDPPGYKTLFQSVQVKKTTPAGLLAILNPSGVGQGQNCDFQSPMKSLANADLDQAVVPKALGFGLGPRCLLFSPPGTRYEIIIGYVQQDLATGRVGVPLQLRYVVEVKTPTRQEVADMVDYFAVNPVSPIQMPCISFSLAGKLRLDALAGNWRQFSLRLATPLSPDTLRTQKSASDQYDARSRWNTDYVVQSDAYPVATFLSAVANLPPIP